MGEAPLSFGHLGVGQPVSRGIVQIRGCGFDSGTTIKVDETNSSVTPIDENTLTVTLPVLSSGGHNLTLNRADGSTLLVPGAIVTP